jgi:hypothetical protein
MGDNLMTRTGLYWAGILILFVVGLELVLVGKDSDSFSQVAVGAAVLAVTALPAFSMATVNLRDHRK